MMIEFCHVFLFFFDGLTFNIWILWKEMRYNLSIIPLLYYYYYCYGDEYFSDDICYLNRCYFKAGSAYIFIVGSLFKSIFNEKFEWKKIFEISSTFDF